MFISIEIRGAAQTVRRRNGEEVSDPITDFEDGEEAPRPVMMARVDLQRINRDGYLEGPRSSVEAHAAPQQDMRVVGSTGGTFTDQGCEDGDDNSQHAAHRERAERGAPTQGELLRLATSRPRRFLRRLHAESRRRGRVTVQFVRPLNTGRAIFEISVDKGQVLAKARVEVARALGGALGAKAQRVKGLARFELEMEASLRSNGDLDRVSGDWRVQGLKLDPREDRLLDRLANTVTRVVDSGTRQGRRQSRLTKILGTWLREHPIWAVALTDRLLNQLEGLSINPSVRQRKKEHKRDRGGPTFDDILNGHSEPQTAEFLLDAVPAPSLRWLDDHTAQLNSSDLQEVALADTELSRLACIIPVLLDILD